MDFVPVAEIDEEIGTIEENLRVLVDESASPMGILTNDILSEQITQQQAELHRLRKLRDDMVDAARRRSR